jgi:GNAT superfamily N-acetyltransferase
MEPDRDIMFVEVAGRPVAMAVTRWWDEADGLRVYRHIGKVLPDWRDRGIGAALLSWAIDHLSEIAEAHGISNRVLRSGVDSFPSPGQALLERFGYRATQHHAELVRPHLDDIPEGPLPEGVEMRPVAERHLRAIFDAEWEASRDHWGYREPTEEDWKWFLEFPHRDESMWKIAWADDQVVGQVRGYINAKENAELNQRRGWCEWIFTKRDYRKQGIATALICATLREFKERGMTEAALGVHVENPNMALRLYTGLGFDLHSQGATYERPLEF